MWLVRKIALRKLIFLSAVIIFSTLFAVVSSDIYIGHSFDNKIFKDIEFVPERPVGLLLGTSKYYNKRDNLYYEPRIRAAAELFHAGKIKAILVSGDNASRNYNESMTMRNDLVRLAVPAKYITLDYAGFRTLDSIVRAEKVFGQRAYTVISQEFHCRRALFISEKYHHDAIGYCAEDEEGPLALKVRAREILARFKAVLDIYVLNEQPRFFGPPVYVYTGSP